MFWNAILFQVLFNLFNISYVEIKQMRRDRSRIRKFTFMHCRPVGRGGRVRSHTPPFPQATQVHFFVDQPIFKVNS